VILDDKLWHYILAGQFTNSFVLKFLCWGIFWYLQLG